MPSENHPLQQPWHRLSNTVSICQFAEAGTESKPLGVTVIDSNNYFKLLVSEPSKGHTLYLMVYFSVPTDGAPGQEEEGRLAHKLKHSNLFFKTLE